MSKVELAGRPEPGYESMEQFAVSVEHVAEMLRTIDFQPGEGAGAGAAEGRAGGGGSDPPEGAAGTAGTPPHGSSSGPGAAGEEEDEEAALDGEEGSAGPEEERPEGESGRGAQRACPRSGGRPPRGAGTHLQPPRLFSAAQPLPPAGGSAPSAGPKDTSFSFL